ncbi:MAG: hypothetical protein LBE62_06270 [Azonexus sp.]|jgi:hypothetical protein|nr:hypothetical protein [Azonexus sp.]
MRAHVVAPAQGWRWLLTGWAIFRRNPPLLSMLVVIYWLTVVFLSALPLIGPIAAVLLIPGLSVGLMQAARHIERGQAAGIQTLFDGLRQNTRTLLALGGLYLLVTLCILGLSTAIDGGGLLRYLLSSSHAERAALADANLALPALFVLILMTPVAMAWWFAPVLAAWHRLSLGRALFFSLAACWINWRALLTYAAAVLLVAGVLPAVAQDLLALLPPGVASLLSLLLVALMMLVVAPVIFASIYASYRDIFGISEIA